MCDLISRQAAIDDFTKWKYQLADCFGEDYSGVSIVESAIKSLEEYPSAQPELIRCKDCKHYTPIKRTDRWWCRCEEGLWSSNEDDFCSYAERRTDDER